MGTLFLAAVASAENTVTINTFNFEDCVDPLHSAELSDQACVQFGSGGQISFDFTNLNLAAGCNIIFTQDDPTCVDVDNVIVPNDFQCFSAVGTLSSDAFASVFCN